VTSARLFCFPYAGSGAAVFAPWKTGVPRGLEVRPVELPGRGARYAQPLFTELVPLAEALARELRPELDAPFAFFGHSLGAILAFEVTRMLRRTQGPMPLHLFVSGSRAPQARDRGAPLYDLPDDDLLAELRRLNGTPAEILDNRELMAYLLPILRADFQGLDCYVCADEAPLDCPVTVFGGWSDERVQHDRLPAWQAQTTGAFRVVVLPGDHFFLHGAKDRLLESLVRDLEAAACR
jgi:medium-chain acyl-[acyl-carrier-protein] hydrolase